MLLHSLFLSGRLISWLFANRFYAYVLFRPDFSYSSRAADYILSNQDLKLICFLPLSANFTYLFRQRLCSRLTALWRYINFELLLLLLLLARSLVNFLTHF